MSKTSTTLLFDYDFLLYKACFAVEKSKIKVINKITSEESNFKCRSDFWGRGKKIGGELAKINKSRTSPYTKEDFEIIDEKELEPFNSAVIVINSMINNICKQLGTNNFYGYSGTGETFRERLATLKPYKGNRENLIKPTYIDDLRDYLCDYKNCEIVKDIEADDAVSMDAYHYYNQYKKTGKNKVITVAIDKDSKGCTGYLFNPYKDFEPLEINGLGTIFNDEGKPDGYGRAWLYYQICRGDDVDFYDPACLSSMKVGDVTAYKALDGCSTDKQYWQAIVNFYKKMYPEPVTFTNFRGDELTVDWLYILQEITDLAHMKRWYDDRLVVKDILDKLKVNYE